jgi:uncharacterized protein YcfL
MRCRKVLQQGRGLMLLGLLLVGCGTQPPVPQVRSSASNASTSLPIATMATAAATQTPSHRPQSKLRKQR